MTQPQLGRTRHRWLVDDIIAAILNQRSCANKILADIERLSEGDTMALVRLALAAAELQKHIGAAMQTAQDMQLLIQQSKDENEQLRLENEQLRAEAKPRPTPNGFSLNGQGAK